MYTKAVQFAILAIATTALTANAELMQGTFEFEELSFQGDTVSGTFEFDSADPSVMTSFALSWVGGVGFGEFDLLNNTNPFIIDITVDALPVYQTGPLGEGLYGSLDTVTVLSGNLPITWGATFAGDFATITVNANDFSFDGVTGPISYTVVPAPSVLATALFGSALLTRRRRA